MNLRVRFAETDGMGIAHHAAYVVWLEAARVAWLRERGLDYRDLNAAGVHLAVSGVEVRYRHAARFDDEVRVACVLTAIRSRRAAFTYALTRVEDGVTLADGATTHVPTDDDGHAVRLPADWLSALQGLIEPAERVGSAG